MNEQTALTVSSPKQLLDVLTKSKSAIEMALPKHLNADRMMRLALTCFSTNPDLRECTAKSILSSIVVASQLGLEPGVAGQGYLIPYKRTCTFVPGWQGLVGLLNNTGRATAWTGAVYEGDVWEFELGSRPRCNHIPGENFGDVDKLIWVYACGKVNGSEQPVVEAWPMSRVIKHRDKYNKVGARHYSYANLEMYARKVVLLQVLKYMPRSIELNNAIVAADAAEIGRSVVVDNGTIIELEDSEAQPANLGNAPAPKAPPTPPSAPVKAPEPRQRTPEPPKPAPAPAKPTPAPAPKPPEPILEVLPEPEAEQETITEASPEPEPEPGPTDPEEGPTEPETQPEPEPEPTPQNEHPKLTELRALIEKSGVTEAQVVGFCQKSKILKADKGENALSFLVKEGPPPSKTPIVSQVNNLIVAWNNILPKIKAL